MKFKGLLVLLLGAASLTFLGCGKDSGSSKIIGAGATFPYPLYSKMFLEYKKVKNVEVNYQGIGSGGGVRQLQQKTINFGATDAFLDEKELKEFGKPIVHIPMALGAVVVIYNIPELKAQLNLSGQITGRIFLGDIKNWNHPDIAKLNPGVKLPNKPISVTRRSDGSGTTHVFSEYLAKVCKQWEKKVGVGKSLSWPVGVGGKGNPGVAGLVKQTPFSIGYVEVAYAEKNKITFAKMQNKKGKFIVPSLKSISVSADMKLPDDLRVSLVDTDAEEGYPITAFTWIIVYQEMSENIQSAKTAKGVADLLNWMIHDGQSMNESLLYGKLSPAATAQSEKLLKTLTYKGKPLL